jgi:[glutamine synthetase] adenylyltransferase / [glutamine synthetase]-adenylyl-L-tyrosine phosphorylase
MASSGGCGGVQVLSLLARNPALLDRLAGVLGAAPQLADHLSRHTAALEGLLVRHGRGTVGNAPRRRCPRC